MNRRAFNLATGAAVLLISIGAGAVYWPAGLIVGGVLVLALTLHVARIAGVQG